MGKLESFLNLGIGGKSFIVIFDIALDEDVDDDVRGVGVGGVIMVLIFDCMPLKLAFVICNVVDTLF
jgi:hypothetical protein